MERDVLAMQLKSRLYDRAGKAVTNFSRTLPAPQSDLAQQTLKDPYTFDFMSMTAPYNERDVERQLTRHITHFLLELGKGFAFIGRQYHLEIAGNDYYIDLLFYHVTLKCYVVVELKNRKFIPEYAGKLNFYLSAVDSLLKRDDDEPTIGLLLCRDKNNIEVEFALRDMNKPMGVSEYSLMETLPDNLKAALPTVEEIERDLKQLPKKRSWRGRAVIRFIKQENQLLLIYESDRDNGASWVAQKLKQEESVTLRRTFTFTPADWWVSLQAMMRMMTLKVYFYWVFWMTGTTKSARIFLVSSTIYYLMLN